MKEGDAYNIADGATKFDQEKTRFDLVPIEPLWDIANVFTYGSKKYDDHNWRRGMRHGRLYASLQRHLMDYWLGEDVDPESGYSHLAHAGCCLMMLMWCQRYQPENDDRYEPVAEE